MAQRKNKLPMTVSQEWGSLICYLAPPLFYRLAFHGDSMFSPDNIADNWLVLEPVPKLVRAYYKTPSAIFAKSKNGSPFERFQPRAKQHSPGIYNGLASLLKIYFPDCIGNCFSTDAHSVVQIFTIQFSSSLG